MKKTLTILGSTGSIGTQALEVAKLRGFGIFALTADRSVDTMEKQIRAFHPTIAAMRDANIDNETIRAKMLTIYPACDNIVDKYLGSV